MIPNFNCGRSTVLYVNIYGKYSNDLLCNS